MPSVADIDKQIAELEAQKKKLLEDENRESGIDLSKYYQGGGPNEFQLVYRKGAKKTDNMTDWAESTSADFVML